MTVPTGTAAASVAAVPGEADRTALEAIAAAVAADEEGFVERLYDRFFERAPAARPLFGAYAVSEMHEMVSETFRSIVAWQDGETWLEANLVALGESHLEYGVEREMYAPFVEVFVEISCEPLDAEVAPAAERTLRAGLEGIVSVMREAGEAARRARTDGTP